MSEQERITQTYKHGSLLQEIRSGVEQLGRTTDTVTIEELAWVDEFHVGGRQASEEFLDQLGLTEDDHVLDIGCGIGGTARFAAQRYKSRVSGIDLMPEYVETGNELNAWLGLDEQVSLYQGSALSLTFDNLSFDAVFMMHVGMNIKDKQTLFSEIYRVLRPGGVLGIYDVMRVGEGDLTYPFPWTTDEASSALATPEVYEKKLIEAGFSIGAQRNRRDFAVEYFLKFKPKKGSPKKPRPPLGLHIIMGDTAALKAKNMVANISAGKIAPIEFVAHKN